MRTHTSQFKEEIKQYGRQFSDTIYYNNATYNGDHIFNVNYSVDPTFCNSIIKTLRIDTDISLNVGDTLDYGISLENTTDEIRYNNFIVNKIEEQKDKKSNLVTCYDNMIKTMKDYETPKVNGVAITFPITIRNYINAICNHLGLTFKNANDTFTNYDKQVTSEHYVDTDGNSLGYTFRDVLDDLSECVGGFICCDNNGDIEIKYIDNTAPLGTIYGNTTQEGTPTPNPYFPQPINVVTGGNNITINNGENLFDINWLGGEGITIENGVLTATIGTLRTKYGYNGSYIPNTNYGSQITISMNAYTDGNEGTSGNGLRLYVTYTDGTQNGITYTNNITTDTNKTFTSNASKQIKNIFFTYGSFPENIWHISKIMITYGNEVKPYKEYVGKTYEINLGINLAYTGWASDFVTRINDTSKADIVEDNNRTCLKFNANAGYQEYDTKYMFKTNWEEKTRYTFSMDFKGVNKYSNMKIEYTDGTTSNIPNPLVADTWEHVTFTTTANKTIKYLRANWSSGYTYIDLNTFQVEKGEIETSYSPYKTPIELNKIGTYQDTIFKSSGKNLFDKSSTPFFAGDTISRFTETETGIKYTPTSNKSNIFVSYE